MCCQLQLWRMFITDLTSDRFWILGKASEPQGDSRRASDDLHRPAQIPWAAAKKLRRNLASQTFHPLANQVEIGFTFWLT